MLELRAEQKTIYKLFSELENYFLIPDYQRPYSWRIDECETCLLYTSDAADE